MNKKLLMSSALVGSLALASAAVAETKITGNAWFTYSAISKTKANSTQGFGREVQLNIAKTGDLNVGGLKYTAGFSMEADGAEGFGADFGEGNYFGIISGDTEVRFNVDKAPSLSQSATPRVGQQLTTQTRGLSDKSYAYDPGVLAQNSFNTALIQKTDVGQFALVYAPKTGDKGGNNDNVLARNADGGRVMDIVYSGNLGVNGLRAVAGYSKMEKETGKTDDTTAKQLGLGYNFGQIAAGVTRNVSTNADGVDVKSNEFGVTIAANDNLSFGVLHAITDTSGANKTDEKISSVGMAYNLGGATFETYYVKLENAAGSKSALDEDKLTVRVSTNF